MLANVSDSFADYFLDLTGEKSIRALARTADLDQSTATRQLNGRSDLRVATVVAICRAYNLPLAPTFVAVGFITENEAREFSGPLNLATVPEIEIAKEMLRRVAAGSATSISTEPLPSEIIDEVLAERSPVRRPDEKDSDYDEEHGVTFDDLMPGQVRTRDEIAAEREAQRARPSI